MPVDIDKLSAFATRFRATIETTNFSDNLIDLLLPERMPVSSPNLECQACSSKQLIRCPPLGRVVANARHQNYSALTEEIA